MERWLLYIDSIIPNSSQAFLDDVEKYDFARDCLPHIQNVLVKQEDVEEAVRAFDVVTHGLHDKLMHLFGKSIDVEIILYLGLCNGAGWVTTFNGQTKILLGIEKIVELGWQDVASMTGLINHELGHAFHEQYGVLDRHFDAKADELLWQLFTEGIAMVFEQMLIGDEGYYHQDQDGWKLFMAQNLDQLKVDFDVNLHRSESARQHFFGDWTSYHGYGDAGYYLGTQFVRFLLEKYAFDELLSMDLDRVKHGYNDFLKRS